MSLFVIIACQLIFIGGWYLIKPHLEERRYLFTENNTLHQLPDYFFQHILCIYLLIFFTGYWVAALLLLPLWLLLFKKVKRLLASYYHPSDDAITPPSDTTN